VTNLGIKILGIHFQYQNNEQNQRTMMIISNNHFMKVVKLKVSEQCKMDHWTPNGIQNVAIYNKSTIYVQTSIDHPKTKARGENLHEGQGVLPKLSPLRQDGSRDSKAGRLDCVNAVQRHSKTKLSSMGAIRLEPTQIRWFSFGHAGTLNHVNGGQGCSRDSQKTTL
jgi:hypothetical protein